MGACGSSSFTGGAGDFFPVIFGNLLVIFGNISQHFSLRCLRQDSYFSHKALYMVIWNPLSNSSRLFLL